MLILDKDLYCLDEVRRMRRKRLKRIFASVMAVVLAVSIMTFGNSPDVYAADVKDMTGWIKVYANNIQNDYLQDQQTGSGSVSQDIVGDADHPSVYMLFTQEEIAIRVRISNVDKTNPYEFKNFVFIGMDADLNGSIDFFLGLYNPTGNNGRLGIYSSVSGYTNMSPSTTGISGKALMGMKPVAGVNYDISEADSNFNGNKDYFISYKFTVADIAQALSGTAYSGFDASTPFRFICGTAAQDNSFNQDINGMDKGGWSAGSTWASLDIFSDIVSADGTAQSRYCMVTFDKNTGDKEANYSVKAVEKDATLGSLPGTNPTKRGMYFQEWNTKPDGTGETINSKTVISGDTTFYAIWGDKEVYTVTFNPNTGNFSGSTTPITVPTINGMVGDNIPADPTGSSQSPVFLGWNTSADGKGTYINSLTPVTGNITVYAQWTNNTKNNLATFYDNIGTDGGTVVLKVYANGNSKNFNGTPPTITRPGYTFGGWFLNDKTCSGSAIDGAKISESGDYYAKWSPATYTVNFDGNGAGDTVENVSGPKSVTDGTFGTMPAEPTREGYKFIEWNRQVDGKGEAMYPSTIISGTTTVYAIWEKETTVTFKANGGAEADQKVNATSGKLDYFPQPVSRDGKTFLGWSESNDNDPNKLIDLAGQKFSTDKTLYAVWGSIYTVNFNGNSGGWGGTTTEITGVPTAYGSVLYIPTAPTRSGYEFTGWKDSSDASGNTFTISTEVSEEITVYAQWKAAGAAPQGVTVTHAVTNLTYSGGTTATTGVAYSDTLTPATGYDRPATITITVNGNTLTAGTDYTYNSGNGAINILGNKITGNIVITAAAQKKTFTVTDQVDHGSISDSIKTVPYETEYNTTITADAGYNLPASVTVKVDGTPLTEGYTYNSTTGAVHIDSEKVTGNITIIATGAALKTYTVDHTLTNISKETGGNTATHGVAYSSTLKADTGYDLPGSITVTVDDGNGKSALTAGTDYTYNKGTGAVTITASKVTGDIEITAAGVIKTFTVVNAVDNSSIPDSDHEATYGTDYITTLTADAGNALPETITITVGGTPLTEGYTYDKNDGVITIAGAKVTGDIEILAGVLTTYEVIDTVEHITFTGGATAVKGVDYEAALTAATGYNLPDSITITVGEGDSMITLTDGDGYSYNSENGEITIYGEKISDKIEIIAAARIKTYSVTDQVDHGTFNGDTVDYNTDYRTTIVADTGYTLPSSVGITVDGFTLAAGDYTYSSTTGEIFIDKSKVTGDIVISANDAVLITRSVTHDVTNIASYTGGTTASYGTDYEDTLTAAAGYDLPGSITITVGGNGLSDTDYSYDSTRGIIVINGNKIIGDITITAAGTRKTFTVTDQVETGTFAGTSATYGTDYNTTIVPAAGQRLPKNIIITVGGIILTSGFTYNQITGAVHINGIEVTGPVVIIAGAEPQPQPQHQPAPVYAGNTYEPETDTPQRGNYPIAYSGTNFSYSGAGKVQYGMDYQTTIGVAGGYQLPSSIVVTAGGILLKPGVDYTYNSKTGEVYIKGAKVTGTIEIKVLPLALADISKMNVRVKDKVPKTGDENQMSERLPGVLAGIGSLALTGMAITIYYDRRKRKL